MHTPIRVIVVFCGVLFGCGAHRSLLNSSTYGACFNHSAPYVSPLSGSASNPAVCMPEQIAGYIMCAERLGIGQQNASASSESAFKVAAEYAKVNASVDTKKADTLSVAVTADANLTNAKSYALLACVRILGEPSRDKEAPNDATKATPPKAQLPPTPALAPLPAPQ